MRRVRRGSVDHVATGAQAARQRAPQVDARAAPGTHRRVRRSPGLHSSRSSARRARMISSAVNSPKSLSASLPTSLHVCSARRPTRRFVCRVDRHCRPEPTRRALTATATRIAWPRRRHAPTCCVRTCWCARTRRTRDRRPPADRAGARAARGTCDRPRRATPDRRAAARR